MQVGAAMFFTDYSMAPAALARALEERGFESLWAPEHSHIPLSRKSSFPSGGELPKQYYDVMDPFVTLTAAAASGENVSTSQVVGSNVVITLSNGSTITFLNTTDVNGILGTVTHH